MTRPAASVAWSTCMTADGRCYLDFGSGMATVNTGHNHPDVMAAAGEFLYPCGSDDHVIRFIPPLTVSEEHRDEGLAVLEEAVTAGR